MHLSEGSIGLKKRSICFYFITILSVFLFTGCRKQPDSAGQVVLYCSVDQTVAEPVVAEFEKQTGIEVLRRYDTEASKTVGLVNKIRAEQKNPAADVFWSSEIFYTIQLADEGLLSPYSSKLTESWPETYRDKDNLWYGLGIRGRVIGYNTSKVTAEESPKSLEDLLDSKWKGRVVMANPARGTTGGDIANWYIEYGEDGYRKLLEGLKQNGIRIVEGNSTAIRMVANGQADVCLTDTDDVYAMQRNKMPVAMNMLRRNGKATLGIPNTAAVIKGGPNPENAKILMGYLLGGECEKRLLESDSHNWPVGYVPDEQFNKYAIEGLETDFSGISKALTAAKNIAREILY